MTTQILLARRSYGGTVATFRVMCEDSQHARLTAEIPSDADFHARTYLALERDHFLADLRRRFAVVVDACSPPAGPPASSLGEIHDPAIESLARPADGAH